MKPLGLISGAVLCVLSVSAKAITVEDVQNDEARVRETISELQSQIENFSCPGSSRWGETQRSAVIEEIARQEGYARGNHAAGQQNYWNSHSVEMLADEQDALVALAKRYKELLDQFLSKKAACHSPSASAVPSSSEAMHLSLEDLQRRVEGKAYFSYICATEFFYKDVNGYPVLYYKACTWPEFNNTNNWYFFSKPSERPKPDEVFTFSADGTVGLGEPGYPDLDLVGHLSAGGIVWLCTSGVSEDDKNIPAWTQLSDDGNQFVYACRGRDDPAGDSAFRDQMEHKKTHLEILSTKANIGRPVPSR